MLNGKQLWEMAESFDLTDDDASVLVFADFLEESGEERLANCIRQIHKQQHSYYRPIWRGWILLLYYAPKEYMAMLCDNWIDNKEVSYDRKFDLNYKIPTNDRLNNTTGAG